MEEDIQNLEKLLDFLPLISLVFDEIQGLESDSRLLLSLEKQLAAANQAINTIQGLQYSEVELEKILDNKRRALLQKRFD